MYRVMITALSVLLFSSSIALAYQFGDLDGDGRIGLTDSIASLQIVAGLSPLIAVPTVRTIVISPDPSDATVGGSRLLSIIAELPIATANDQWLIKLEPGIYDLGTTTCVVPAYVHLEGSGMGVTILRSTASYALDMPGTSQLRLLSVERRSGTSDWGYGVMLRDGYPMLQDVAISAVASNSAVGITVSDLNKVILKNVHIDVAGAQQSFGIQLSTSDAELFDVEISAHGQSHNWGFYVFSAGTSQKITMQHARIHVWQDGYPAAGTQMGIQGHAGLLSISDSEILAETGNSAFGVSSGNSGELLIRNSEITAQWAATYNYGVNNSGSARTFVYSSKVGGTSGAGASSWAILNTNLGDQVFVEDTDIAGKVRNDSQNKIWVSSSKFRSGTGSVTGLVTCAGVIDQAYNFYSLTCP